MSRFLQDVEYDPLRPEPPELDIYDDLIRKAGPVTRLLVKRLIRSYQEGHTDDDVIWDDWLTLFTDSHFGPGHPDVATGLLALTFERHELRHHVDTYWTPLGWGLPMHVARLYLRLREFGRTKAGTSESQAALARAAHSLSVLSLLAGNVPRFAAGDWGGDVLLQRPLPGATMRFRRSTSDPTLGVASIQLECGVERALSPNAVLEARAILETTGHMAGRLRHIGASEPDIVDAIDLLLKNTNLTRDDYWVLIQFALRASDSRAAAAELARDHKPAAKMKLATWFALHSSVLTKVDVGIGNNVALRAVVGLRELMRITDQQLTNPRSDWEAALEQLQEMVGSPPLAQTIAGFRLQLAELRAELRGPRLPISGLAGRHVEYLIELAETGIRQRSRTGRWIDGAGWPESEDPRCFPELVWDDSPSDVSRAWSRLSRVRTMILSNSLEPKLREVVTSLVD
jgi:hypothetical protein